MEINQPSDKLQEAIEYAKASIFHVSKNFKKEWKNNPSTSVRAILGYWMTSATRHLAAMITLSTKGDLSKVASPHHRQLTEIFIQARHFLSLSDADRDYFSQVISASGMVDYLEKLKPLKDHPEIKPGYDEVTEKLEIYDRRIIDEIYENRAKRKFNWFGMSFSKLAEHVSKDGEDYSTVYQIISSETHGVLGVLDIQNPKPGELNFRGYPDKETLDKWAADQLDQAARMFLVLWEEIAEDVGVG